MYASLLRWGRLLIAGLLIFFLVKKLYKLLAERRGDDSVNVLPPATATLVARLFRLWALGAELILGGVAFGIYFRQRHIQQN